MSSVTSPPPLPVARVAPPPLSSPGLAPAGKARSPIRSARFAKRPFVLAAVGAVVIALSLITTLTAINLTGRSLFPRDNERSELHDEAGRGDRNAKKPVPNAQVTEPIAPPAGEPAPVEGREAIKVAVREPPLEGPPHSLTTQEVVARSEASIALIKGRAGSGTGFLVRPGILATNAHVIANEPMGGLTVHFPSAPAEARGPFLAQLQYKDSRRDLALLSIATRSTSS